MPAFANESSGNDVALSLGVDLGPVIAGSKKADEIISRIGSGSPLKLLDDVIAKTAGGFSKAEARAILFGGSSATAADKARARMVLFGQELDKLDKAFSTLGIESQASLQKQAQQAQRAYETIAKSGRASSEDLIRAQAAVDKALGKTRIEADKTATAFEKFQGKVKGVSSGLTSAGTALSVSVTAPLVLLSKRIFDVGRDYELASNTFQSATQATAAEMIKAGQVAEALGADLKIPGTSAASAMSAMTELGKANMTAAQAMEATRGTVLLAAAAQIEEAQAATITANALNAFELEASESVRVSDLLAASANASSGEITDMAAGMQQSAAGAHALRIPIEDLVTSLGLLANAGIKGSDGGTSLKTMLASLTPTTQAAQKALKDLGIDAFNSQGQFVGLKTIIEQAQPALARMTQEQQALAIKVAFGSDAQRAANILLGEGAAKFQQMHDAVTRVGAAEDLAAAKTKGLGGSIDGLISQLETVGLKVFQTVAPSLESMVRKLADAAGGFSQLNPKVIQATITLSALAAGGGPLLLITGQLLKLNPILAASAVAIGTTAFAYKLNLGQMADAVDRFASVFSLKINSTKSPLDVLLTTLDVVGTAFGQMVAETVDALDVLVTSIKTVAIAGGKALIGDFSGAIDSAQEGSARISEILESANRDRQQRQKEWQAIWRGGWREHYAELERMSGLGGLATGNEFIKSFEQSFGGFDLNGILAKELVPSGPTLARARSMGFKIATATKEGHFLGSHQSPHFIVHELLNALIIAQNTVPQYAVPAGKKVAKALKDAFLSEFDTGFEGLQKAIGIITPKLGTGDLDSLFKPMTEAAKKAAQGTKDALGVIKDSVNDYLQSVGLTARVTEAELAKMTAAHSSFLINKANAHAKSVKAEQDAQLSLLQTYNVTTDQINAFLKSKGSTVVLTATDILESNNKHRSSVIALGAAYAYWSNVAAEVNKHYAVMRATLPHLYPPMIQLIDATLELTAAEKALLTEADKMAEALGKRSTDALDKMREEHKKLADAAEEAARRIPSAWDNLVEGILKGSGKIGPELDKLRAKVKGTLGDVLDVFSTMPGAIGDRLRESSSKITQWLDFANATLKLANRVWEQIPASVGEIFKRTQKDIQTSTGAVAGSMDDLLIVCRDSWGGVGESTATAAGQVEAGSSRMVTALMAIGAAAATVGQMIGGRAGSVISGAGAGLSLGAAIGSLFGPGPGTAIGAVIGAGVGGLIGLFSGKSEAQKRAEAQAEARFKLELEQMKANLAKTLADVQSQMMDVFNKGFDFLTKLPDFTRVPKKAFADYRHDMTELVNLWVDISKQFGAGLLDGAKLLGESMGPAVETANNSLSLLNNIGNRLPVTRASIERAGSDIEILFGVIVGIAERLPNKLEKEAKRMGNRLAPAVALWNDSIGGLKEAFDLKEIPAENFGIWERSVEIIMQKTGGMAERFDKFWTKQMAFFAERAGAAMGFYREGVAAIREGVDVPRLDARGIDLTFADLELLVAKGIDFARSMPAELLSMLSATADRIIPWLNVIKLMGEAFSPLKDYKSVQAELAVLLDDFKASTFIMRILDDYSLQIETYAGSIESHLLKAVTSMKNGIGSFGPEMAKLSGLLVGGLSTFTHVADPSAVGDDFSGLAFAGAGGTNFAASSFATPAPVALVPSSVGRAASSSTTTTNITHIENFNVTPPAGLTDAQMRAFLEQQERVARQRANARGRRGDEL